MRKFPENHADMLQYRIILGAKQKKFDEVSKLFQEYYSPQIAGEYWNYAISGNRIEDLRFLARNPQYQPYCQSAILLAEGKKVEALNILANADAGGNEDLLFYAAKTLAENDRHNEALKLYKLFPEKSSYRLDVLLNSAELYSALGNYDEAVKFAQMAYQIAPTLSVVQYCLADKLYKNGQVSEIADIAKFDKSSPFSDKMREFLIVSLEFNLKNCNLKSDKDKIINKIERLLRLDPENKIALEYRNKIKNLRRQE